MFNFNPAHPNYSLLKKMCDDPNMFEAIRTKSVWVSNMEFTDPIVTTKATTIKPPTPLNKSSFVIETPPDAVDGEPLEPQIELISSPPAIESYHIYYRENYTSKFIGISNNSNIIPSSYETTNEAKTIDGKLFYKYTLAPGNIGTHYFLSLTEEASFGEKIGLVGDLFFLRKLTPTMTETLNPNLEQKEFGFMKKDYFDVFFTKNI